MTLMFFMLLSTAFWFLTTLNKTYEGEISYPVKFTNFDENKNVLNNLPKKVKLRIKSDGFTLLRYKWAFTLMPHIIDVKKYFIKQYQVKNTYFLLTSKIKSDFRRTLGSELTIIDIMPDSIIMQYTQTVSKRVKVIPNIKYKLSKQFMLRDDIVVYPDSITITGPEQIIDTIEFVKTKPLQLGVIEKTISRNIGLEPIDEINTSEKRVDFKVEVEKFTEAKLSLSISIKNLPDTATVMIMPSKINISYLVSLSEYENIKPEMFKAVVDYNTISTTSSDRIKVKLIKYPSHLKRISFSPHYAKYIIYKND